MNSSFECLNKFPILTSLSICGEGKYCDTKMLFIDLIGESNIKKLIIFHTTNINNYWSLKILKKYLQIFQTKYSHIHCQIIKEVSFEN
jgi:hypothetical protein